MRYKILIVDDEPGITDMIREYFEPEYEVYTADSGEEAIKKLSVKPDLILLDINMPKMDGLEVCRKIRGFVTCPILFLTARVESLRSALTLVFCRLIPSPLPGTAGRCRWPQPHYCLPCALGQQCKAHPVP